MVDKQVDAMQPDLRGVPEQRYVLHADERFCIPRGDGGLWERLSSGIVIARREDDRDMFRNLFEELAQVLVLFGNIWLL